MVKIFAQLEVALPYNARMKKGDIVKIDALKITPEGALLRVTNIRRKPQWFHSDWFRGLEGCLYRKGGARR